MVLAQNADSFDSYRGIKTPEDYGKYFIQSSGHYEYGNELGEYYDYERFGKDRIAREHGVFDEAGYIAYMLISGTAVQIGLSARRKNYSGRHRRWR